MNAQKRKTGLKKALRILLSAVSVLLLALGLALLFRSMVNGMFVTAYENGNYAEYPEKLLLPLSAAGDGYVVPYNLGDAAYRREEYDLAARYFSSALEKDPPAEDRDCSVRINLALSRLHAFPFETLDTGNADEVEKALVTLYSARSLLTENGCAEESADSFSGHSRDAEKLKQDIDEMIRKLNSPPPPSPGEDGSGGLPEEDPRQQENEDGQRDEKEDGERPEGEKSEEESRQQALQDRLREQKEELDTESYDGGGGADFTYIDTGETVGFGEGVPW